MIGLEDKKSISQNQFKLFLSAINGFFLILIISCVIYDIMTYVNIKQKENKIEREYCIMVKILT